MTEGAHDMGGARGFGKVTPEANEPVFHAEWERRAFALTLAMATPGGWNIDMSRAAIPTPAKPTISTGSLHWNNWWRKKA